MIATWAASTSLSPKRISSVAGGSVSLTTGTPAQQSPERVARIDAARAPREVVAREQHLGGNQLVVAEQPFVVGEQPALQAASAVGQGRHQARPLGDAQHV